MLNGWVMKWKNNKIQPGTRLREESILIYLQENGFVSLNLFAQRVHYYVIGK